MAGSGDMAGMAFVVGYTSCHYEWLVPGHTWSGLVESAFASWQASKGRLDATTDHYLKQQGAYSAPAPANNDLPLPEEVELHPDVVERNEEVAKQIRNPTLIVPGPGSVAASQVTRLTQTTVGSFLASRYKNLISCFERPGVITKNAHCHATKVWQVVNDFCIRNELTKFKSAQALARLLNDGFKKTNSNLRIQSKDKQKQRNRVTLWNVSAKRLAEELSCQLALSSDSDD